MRLRRKLRFCSNCDAYLREVEGELWCPKCKKSIHSNSKEKREVIASKEYKGIYLVNKSDGNLAETNRSCSECGNFRVFYWFSRINGEHAGIRHERIIRHFRCTKCSHEWSEGS